MQDQPYSDGTGIGVTFWQALRMSVATIAHGIWQSLPRALRCADCGKRVWDLYRGEPPAVRCLGCYVKQPRIEQALVKMFAAIEDKGRS